MFKSIIPFSTSKTLANRQEDFKREVNNFFLPKKGKERKKELTSPKNLCAKHLGPFEWKYRF